MASLLVMAAGLMTASEAQARLGAQMTQFCTDFFADLFADNDLEMTLNENGFVVTETRFAGSPVGNLRGELLNLIGLQVSDRENNCLNFIAVDVSVTSPVSSSSSGDMESLFAPGS